MTYVSNDKFVIISMISFLSVNKGFSNNSANSFT
jgi:hypothetical protein